MKTPLIPDWKFNLFQNSIVKLMIIIATVNAEKANVSIEDVLANQAGNHKIAMVFV